MITFSLSSFFQIFAQTTSSINIPESSVIDQWLQDAKVPAVAIATIESGQLNPFLIHGNTAMETPAVSNTIFDVASLTKSITTILTLELVADKMWDLDEPLFHYWIDPEVENDPSHQLLTTRHVLSHRSGFKNWRRMNEDKKLAFDFEPGTQFQYSGEGFEYLRKALENKFNTPFETLVDSLVFQANHMKNSYLTWNKKINDQYFAGTHNQSGEAYEYERSTQSNAADNLLTTIEDMGTLGLNIINRELLSEDLYKEMIRPHSTVREGISFGLGWIVFNDLTDGEYALFNAGSDQGGNALIVLLPESKRGLVVMTNGDNGRGLAMKAIGEILGQTGQEILGRF